MQRFVQQPDDKKKDMSLVGKFLSHIKINLYLNDAFCGNIVGGCFSISLIQIRKDVAFWLPCALIEKYEYLF